MNIDLLRNIHANNIITFAKNEYMKYIITVFILMILLIIGCGSGADNNDTQAKELELKAKELELKEKELELQEKEMSVDDKSKKKNSSSSNKKTETKSSEKSSPTEEEVHNKKVYDEFKSWDTKVYLQETNWKVNLVANTVFSGVIANFAYYATFYDVKVKITYFDKNGEAIGSENIVLNESCPPESHVDFKVTLKGWVAKAKSASFEIKSVKLDEYVSLWVKPG